MKLSLCMIVKNEADVLARCLNSVASCVDEIVIADTGSTDDTRSIARQYTRHVFDEPWRDDFAAARNASFARATGDYLLWMDADDVLLPEDRTRLTALRDKLPQEEPDLVFAKYRFGSLCYLRERIVRRTSGFMWTGRVHECIVPRGKILHADFGVQHLPRKKKDAARNLRIYRLWQAETTLHGRDLFYYGRELYYNGLYTEAVAVLREMLNGEGWYVNKIEACRTIANCKRARGDTDGALEALLQSFRYGAPRGGICCDIGELFLQSGRDEEAAFWLETALNCPDRSGEGDFDCPEERTLRPLLALTRLAYLHGRQTLALQYHRRAEALYPEHPAVRCNRTFFERKSSPPS